METIIAIATTITNNLPMIITTIVAGFTAIAKMLWYLTKPKLYVKEFGWSESPADKTYRLYFARIGIVRFRKWRIIKLYKGPKIKFDGIVIWNNKEYNLDWPSGQEFSEEGKLHLLRKGRFDGRVFLYSNGRLNLINPEEYINIRVFSKDKNVGGIDETWKVDDIIKKSVELDYNLI